MLCKIKLYKDVLMRHLEDSFILYALKKNMCGSRFQSGAWNFPLTPLWL